jgi:signal transduction histidine kinase
MSRHELHVLANTNESIIRTSEQFLALLGPSPFPDLRYQALENVAPIFRPSAMMLERHLTTFIQKLSPSTDGKNQRVKQLEHIGACVTGISSAISDFGLASPNRLMEYASAALQVIDQLQKSGDVGTLPKELTKNIRLSARDLGRLIYIYNLQRNAALLRHNGLLLRARLSATPDDLEPRPSGREHSSTTLVEVLSHAIEAIQPLANARGIRIDQPKDVPQAIVKIPRDTAIIGLKNLLDNAIKYTGILPSDSSYREPWVKLRLLERPSTIELEIESWGAPITREEHLGQLYFKRGYRGQFAFKLGIRGSGIGLSETKEAFEKYAALIRIDTHPVDKFSSADRSVKTSVFVEFQKLVDEIPPNR